MIGRTLGHYEIIEPLGAGGMGEVYRARDTELKRQVAVKVLPPHLTADETAMARFRREAEMLAAVNHPGIATIFSVEESEGTRFLVLELVEGETLAARLSRGPLPLEDSLEISRQIADALEAAHERGIVHRDLKPANVMLNPEGRVKVLDFGLALPFQLGEGTDLT
jgi:serine/threonine protein kinase